MDKDAKPNIGGAAATAGTSTGGAEIAAAPGRLIVKSHAAPRAWSAQAVCGRGDARGAPACVLNLVPDTPRPGAAGAKGARGKRAGSRRTWLGRKDERQAGAPGGDGQNGQQGGHGTTGTQGPTLTIRLSGTPRHLAGA